MVFNSSLLFMLLSNFVLININSMNKELLTTQVCKTWVISSFKKMCWNWSEFIGIAIIIIINNGYKSFARPLQVWWVLQSWGLQFLLWVLNGMGCSLRWDGGMGIWEFGFVGEKRNGKVFVEIWVGGDSVRRWQCAALCMICMDGFLGHANFGCGSSLCLFLLQPFTSSDYQDENPKMGRIKGNWTLILKKYWRISFKHEPGFSLNVQKELAFKDFLLRILFETSTWFLTQCVEGTYTSEFCFQFRFF